MKKRYVFSFLMLFWGMSLLAQNSTQGTEFWFSYMENGYKYNGGLGWVDNTVMVSAKRACSGTISKPDGSLPDIPFTVGANGITNITIPEEYAYNDNNSEEIGHKSLVLRATDTVSVFISNIATYSFDASFVLPIESLGSEYYIQCFDQEVGTMLGSGLSDRILTSAFLIVAVEDNTVVDITTSEATEHGFSFPGVPTSVTLNAGETFFVRSNYNGDWRDLSGSLVMAHDGKKIAVFNGNTTTCIPIDVGNGRDHIFEQALPVDSWGQQFAVTTSQGRARDFVKITSAGEENVVKRNGNPIATLDIGESFVFTLSSNEGSCFIETTQPSVVYIYNTTGQDPEEPFGNNGDPSMAWIPPVEQRIDEITFCTFNSDYEFASIDNHYVNIVVERDDVGRVYLDGALIGADEFHPVNGSSDYSFVRKHISHGTHHLACATGLIAHVYGFGDARGYAYCVGANVVSLTQKLLVNGVWSELYHDGLYMCNDEIADMTVETNYPINGVSWIFGDGQIGTGIEVSHQYEAAGDYVATAYINGTNEFSLETVYDTLSVEVHVGVPEHHVLDTAVCDVDVFDFYGVDYFNSGHFERVGTSIYGCDSTYILTIDMEFTPSFSLEGTHWPIGGSETHISVNEYAVHFDEPRTRVDTVLWQIDCPNWYVMPHGDKGKECTLYIHSYLLEPVTLHAWALNRCDTIHEEFFIQTSYYDVDDNMQEDGFEIAPNPTTGSVTLHFGNLNGPVEIQVFNSIGQQLDMLVVDANSCREQRYDMTEMKNGLYLFVVKNKDKCLTRKVTLSR